MYQPKKMTIGFKLYYPFKCNVKTLISEWPYSDLVKSIDSVVGQTGI